MAAEIEKVILAGTAGQRVLEAGKLLAHAGMQAGLEVSWVPDLGPLGAGISVVCTVILARGEIGSPLVSVPDVAIPMTPAARDRLYPTVKAGGLLVDGGGQIEGRAPLPRDDVRRVPLPITRLAAEAEAVGHEERVALGAFGALSALLEAGALARTLRDQAGEGAEAEAGARALEAGAAYVRERRYMKEGYALSIFER